MNGRMLLLGVILAGGIGLLVGILATHRRVRRLERFRRDFVAQVSHEFRTPLSVIKGYTETLSEKRVDPHTSRSFLRAIQDHTERLIQMVEELLELSRLETVRPRGTAVLIHLPHFFETLRGRFRSRLEAQGIRWVVELIPPLENIESDRELLELIFNNLVDNALKYTDGAGEVRIRGERVGRRLQFSVEDQGIGISRKDQGRLFERFYRVERGRGSGTGLGLSIVKHAVQALGGKIGVESGPGKGSRFTLTIRSFSG